MGESTLIIVALIKDIMIIISLGLLIATLSILAIVALRLRGPIQSLKQTMENVEETSGVIRDTTQNVSKTLKFFGGLNTALERVRGRRGRSDEGDSSQ